MSIQTNQPANWKYWNQQHVLTVDQCIYLTLGIEPGAPLSKKKQAKYNEISIKVSKAQADGSFPGLVAGKEQ